MPQQPVIGLIGAGLMGHGIGKNLLEKGFPLAVLGHRNRAPVEDLVNRGAVEARDVADLARQAEVIILCVTGSTQVEDLFRRAGGLLDSARPGFTVIDTSTSEPTSTLKLAEALRLKGGELVDAPLGRTPAEAEAGKLNTIVGAPPETLERLRPVFAAYCENIFHAGARAAAIASNSSTTSSSWAAWLWSPKPSWRRRKPMSTLPSSTSC